MRLRRFSCAQRGTLTGWLADCGAIESACGIEKLKEVTRRRRCTGGVLTTVTTCGLLADWMELWRGESLELVYLFLLRLYKDLKDASVYCDQKSNENNNTQYLVGSRLA